MSSTKFCEIGIVQALRRARTGIFAVAFTYFISIAIGAAMVHTGSGPALRFRDKIVADAQKNSGILSALRDNRPMKAACMDFAGNLTGGVASTLAGYWAPAVFPIVVYRGWIGGIVSVNGRHNSRLADASERFYYLLTMMLQIIPYSLAGGAGVNIGIARVRPEGYYSGPKVFGVPRAAFCDAAVIYLLIVPLFFIASTFEFLFVP
jgi:hypothetical protein